MTNKTLEQRIAELETNLKRQISGIQNKQQGVVMLLSFEAEKALVIIKELQSKPCEYIHQGKGTSYCKLAASHAKELEEARRVIEELRAQLESKNEHISNLINGE